MYRRFGTLALIHDLIISAINRLFYFRVLVIYIKDQTVPTLQIPEHIDVPLEADRLVARVTPMSLKSFPLETVA